MDLKHFNTVPRVMRTEGAREFCRLCSRYLTELITGFGKFCAAEAGLKRKGWA
jgi:hypothetical protein